jgi:LuxR family transcriptional regulator, maltose regulon positive regulatory protein
MTSASSTAGPASSELILKTTPPRAPRHQLVRSRLGLDDERFRQSPIVVVQAPPGFGKTALIAQWRREHLAAGAAVAWFLADDRDDPQRFLNGLVTAIRLGCGRPTFGRFLLDPALGNSGDLEGITAWLAELAQSSLDIVLIVDEADRLNEASFAGLTYLLNNAPPNLRIIAAARSGLDGAVEDLLAYGRCVAVGPETLRFRLDEAIALVRERFGGKVDADTGARVHAITEGWPLGIQLALSAMERGVDPRAVIDAMAARSADRRDQLVQGLLAGLSGEDIDFLTRIATVDQIHPDLCRALTGSDQAPERLQRLIGDTPVFVAGDGSEWCRLHTLARETFRERLAGLPASEQIELRRRATRWLATQGLLEEAARHALAAGDRETAFDLAERCMYDAVIRGQLGAALEWFELLPESELAQRPRLRLAAAWALALSERHEQAERLVSRILDDANADAEADAPLRYECALIASGAAYYADDPDRCVALFEPWTGAPPQREPRILQMHANRLSVMAILRGDPAQARHHQLTVPRGRFGKAYDYAGLWGNFIVGLSYFCEGQMLLGEEVLRPAIESAEADLGRRHPLACMLGALLAAIVYERDRLDEAAALLANRLDVLQRAGTPDTALLGYRTAARIAAAQGSEHRALDLLEALYAIGVARSMPRLCVASLADQVRIHAGRFRPETCRLLGERIDTLAAEVARRGPLWERSVSILQVLAQANTAIAAQDWRAAIAALTRAAPLADGLRFGRLRIEVMALRAYVLDRNSDDGRPLLREAMNLAQTYGLARTFADAHPGVADFAQRVAAVEPGDERAPALARPIHLPVQRPGGAPRALPSMALTPKEREVLELLARKLSNKEIGQAMAVGEQTVKWHLKNLFGKLDAASRKHAVRRAQVLGLLEGGE